MNIRYEETKLSSLSNHDIGRLKRLCFKYGTMRTMIEDFQDGNLEDNDIILAFDQTKIVGWATIFDSWYTNDFVQVFVSPKYRNKKIGSKLVELTTKKIKKAKACPHDSIGNKLYEKFDDIEIVSVSWMIEEKNGQKI